MGDKFEQFSSKLAELPLDQMLEDVRDAIRSLRELLGAPELRGAFRKADRAMGDLSPTLGEARRTLADARKLLDTVGTVKTKELLFTGALLDAESARSAGLVTRVVPDTDLEAATHALAADIAANAPLSLRTMKAAINEANRFRDRKPSAELAAQAAATRRSQDLQEGLRAVFEKRRPIFRGH